MSIYFVMQINLDTREAKCRQGVSTFEGGKIMLDAIIRSDVLTITSNAKEAVITQADWCEYLVLCEAGRWIYKLIRSESDKLLNA